MRGIILKMGLISVISHGAYPRKRWAYARNNFKNGAYLGHYPYVHATMYRGVFLYPETPAAGCHTQQPLPWKHELSGLGGHIALDLRFQTHSHPPSNIYACHP
jgi:hypothetical protein